MCSSGKTLLLYNANTTTDTLCWSHALGNTALQWLISHDAVNSGGSISPQLLCKRAQIGQLGGTSPKGLSWEAVKCSPWPLPTFGPEHEWIRWQFPQQTGLQPCRFPSSQQALSDSSHALPFSLSSQTQPLSETISQKPRYTKSRPPLGPLSTRPVAAASAPVVIYRKQKNSSKRNWNKNPTRMARSLASPFNSTENLSRDLTMLTLLDWRQSCHKKLLLSLVLNPSFTGTAWMNLNRSRNLSQYLWDPRATGGRGPSWGPSSHTVFSTIFSGLQPWSPFHFKYAFRGLLNICCCVLLEMYFSWGEYVCK